MPNRILKESICTSESIDALTPFEETFFCRLIVNCDDYGRMDARPSILRARLFPLKERLTLRDIESALEKLTAVGCVEVYEVGGKPYLQFLAWEVHQQVRAKKSRYPAKDSGRERVKSSDIKCNQMISDVPVIQSESESESESNGVDGDRAREGIDPMTYARRNLLSLSSGNCEDMRQFLEDGMAAEAICYAIDQATAQGKVTWAYVQGILNRWLVAGIRTLGAAKDAERQHQQRKRGGATDAKHGRLSGSNSGESGNPEIDPAEIERIARMRGVLPPLP